eukprot:scaffold133387_cov66-Phaeocystis_antarctica.AAC.4
MLARAALQEEGAAEILRRSHVRNSTCCCASPPRSSRRMTDAPLWAQRLPRDQRRRRDGVGRQRLHDLGRQVRRVKLGIYAPSPGR